MDRSSLNIQDKKHLFWAARFTMHLCQLAQYADTLMKLDGNKPSSLTASQPSSKRCDSQRDRPAIDLKTAAADDVARRMKLSHNGKYLPPIGKRARVVEFNTSLKWYYHRCVRIQDVSVCVWQMTTRWTCAFCSQRVQFDRHSCGALDEYLILNFLKVILLNLARETTTGHPQRQPKLAKPRNKRHSTGPTAKKASR